jgi:prepilin-type N-terminal cleavage/methylation domain-containing protein
MKSRQSGFTLIEICLVLIILTVIATVIANVLANSDTFSEQMQRGGVICKGGVLFNIDVNGHQTQIIGPNGGGLQCQ